MRSKFERRVKIVTADHDEILQERINEFLQKHYFEGVDKFHFYNYTNDQGQTFINCAISVFIDPKKHT